MKQFIMGITIILLLVLPACQIITEDKDLESNTEDAVYLKSDLARETSATVNLNQMIMLAEDNAAFAFTINEQINQTLGEYKNFVFSPLSLSLALSMTLAGAESTTEQGMLEALHLSTPEKEIYPSFNALLLAIEKSQEITKKGSEGSQFQINIANSIWGQAGYTFEAEFLDTLAKYYGAGVYNVDFRRNPVAAINAINAWVEDETQEKIQDLIPSGAINELTRLVLANAIYFNGSWLYPFDAANTSAQPFKMLDGSEVTVELMKLSGINLAYYQGENFQTVSLPYLSTDFNMMIVLPDAGKFQEFDNQLSTEVIKTIINEMQFVNVDLSMPKFDFESTLNANNALKALGMEEAFDVEKADFSGITQEDELMITDVLHKTTITVDEEGTEAAAASAVIVGIRSFNPEEPIALVIDRPFQFFIMHKPTNAILFMGKVMQP
jgi:serpin B